MDESLSDAENDLAGDCYDDSSQNNLDLQADLPTKDGTVLFPNQDKRPKIFSKKRKDGNVTSRIGDLLQQKLPLPYNCKQTLQIQKKGDSPKIVDMPTAKDSYSFDVDG